MCHINVDYCALSQTFLKQRVIRVNDLCNECKFIMFLGDRIRIWCVKQILAVIDVL